MNYLKYNNSLTLNSTFDSTTSRPQIKRHGNIRYQGSERVAGLNNNTLIELRCSAGVLRTIKLEFTLIENASNEIGLIPAIRSSDVEVYGMIIYSYEGGIPSGMTTIQALRQYTISAS
ncbi:42697_t:CDS:2, partial [Gigaspora margarita]